MKETDAQPRRFDWVGERLCLDLTNTVNRPEGREYKEHLNDYSDLIAWVLEAGLLTQRRARRLLRIARESLGEAEDVVQRAQALRDAVYRTLTGLAQGERPAARDLATLNGEIGTAMSRARIRPTADGFSWNWQDEETALDQVLWPVARSAAELLTSVELAAIHECEGHRCSYLFVDLSRNHRRRWCDMKVCGNRAKVRRHRQRQKGGASSA